MDTKQRRRHQRGLDRVFYAGGDGILMVPIVKGGAGSYADVPSRRMAYDADGTVVALNAAPTIEMSAGNITELNDEDNTRFAWGTNNVDLVFIFPELREFDGAFGAIDEYNRISYVQTSVNTTNGTDGTWVQQTANLSDVGEPYPTRYRTDITSFAVSNVRGVRFRRVDSQEWIAWHMYGEISAGETPDRLLWFDNDDDLEFSKPQDYGDVPRGSAEDHVIYLKNNSASLSANTVQVTAEDLYLGSGAWYTFDDGTGFAATKALASSIANGANSPDITIRRITPDAATLGLHAARAYVNVGSWT